MKNTGHNKQAKQADTLETSKKLLQKALMGALHNGGFLFSNNGKGAITPVIINATVQQIIVAVIAFLFSRTKDADETVGLYDYIIATADRISKMRLRDVSAPAKGGSEGSEGSK